MLQLQQLGVLRHERLAALGTAAFLLVVPAPVGVLEALERVAHELDSVVGGAQSRLDVITNFGEQQIVDLAVGVLDVFAVQDFKARDFTRHRIGGDLHVFLQDTKHLAMQRINQRNQTVHFPGGLAFNFDISEIAVLVDVAQPLLGLELIVDHQLGASGQSLASSNLRDHLRSHC